jgi:hypothetical protein
MPRSEPVNHSRAHVLDGKSRRSCRCPEVKPYFPDAQRGDNHKAGHRVDWDFVVDHAKQSIDNDGDGSGAGSTAKVDFGLEDLANGADNHKGIDFLFWGIAPTSASLHPAPDVNNGGHDHVAVKLCDSLLLA